MEFTEKYISVTDKGFNMDSKKNVISDDAYAIGEVISNLIKQLEKERQI